MSEEFDFPTPEEDAVLDFLRRLRDGLPQADTWIVHPVNYPRIHASIEKILSALREAEPDLTYTVAFDELFGADMRLTVWGYVFDFYSCREIAEVLSLADAFEMEAMTNGKIRICFAFCNARIPIFPKFKETPG